MPVLRLATAVALVSPSGATVTTLAPTAMTWTLDEGVAPMVTARVVVAMPSALQFAMMKPGAGYYLSLTADADGATPDPVLLKITDRSRTVEGNVSLEAASAELELQSFTPAVVDRSNWTRQSSVAAILADVLSKTFGAAGWTRSTYADAYGQDIGVRPYTTYSSVTNLVPNGSFERDTAGWVGQQATIARTSVAFRSGAYGLAVTPSNSNASSRAEFTANLTTNRTYTMSAWVRIPATMTGSAATAGRQLQAVVTVGGTTFALATGAAAPNVANTWQRVTLTFTTPPLMDSSVLLRVINGTSTANQVTMYVDDVLLVEGDGLDTDGATPLAFFDGDTVDSDTYNYDWSAAVGSSSSTRTPVRSRDPESLTWSPGQWACEFLTPILQAVGVRLWSTGYVVSGGAVVARMHWALNEYGRASRAPAALDTLNLFDVSQVDSWSATFPDGTPMYADQVIIHYAWTDNLGVAHEAYDVHPATGKKPYYLDLADTPFPGVGRAQGIYNRIVARATVFSGSMAFDRAVAPGKQLSITSSKVAAGAVVGYLEAVTYDPFRGTTEFRTKQTVAYTSASWFAATGSWASQTGSWAADQ